MPADKHPYVTSPGPFIQVINHLRNSFPITVTADTMKKLGFAPKNETYIINTIRFLGLIDDDGNRTDIAGSVFSLHQDQDFQPEFSKLVQEAYTELFSLFGDAAWALDSNALITFFRQTDQSTAVVGQRQATTFKALAGIAGHAELPEPKPSDKEQPPTRPVMKQKSKKQVSPEVASSVSEQTAETHGVGSERNFGLTVRIEINLPSDGDQETYDRIFKSIRENLLNG